MKYEMSKEDYFMFIDMLHEEMKALVIAKNTDYTAGGGPFANFKASEGFGVDPLVGLSVRLGDKIQRLKSFCKTGDLAVKDEGAEDIFRDLIGYSWIALALLEERKKNEAKV